MTNSKKDLSAAVDQKKVVSKVKVDGVVTIRTYSDGAIQRNVWPTKEEAEEYAASVAEQKG